MASNIGDHIHVHESTVNKTVKSISKAIAIMRLHFIKMPYTMQDIITNIIAATQF